MLAYFLNLNNIIIYNIANISLNILKSKMGIGTPAGAKDQNFEKGMQQQENNKQQFTDSEEEEGIETETPDFSSADEMRNGVVDRGLELKVHQLSPKWVLWLWMGERQKDWGDCLYKQCLVNSVEDFFALKHRILPPSRLPNDYLKYMFFKEGIKPTWEDPCNRHGGSIDLVIPNAYQHTHLDRLWFELLMAVMGGKFGECNKQICGVVLNFRRYGYAISLWISDVNERKGHLVDILEAKLGIANKRGVQICVNKHQLPDDEAGMDQQRMHVQQMPSNRGGFRRTGEF